MKNLENLKHKKHILFDLDGTITDPKEGIVNSVLYSLEKLSIPFTEDKDSLTSFIGAPLVKEYMTRFGLNEDDANKALFYYREYYKDKGIFECKLFDGTKTLFEHLKNNGKKMYLATSKATPFAIDLLNHFEIASYFEFIGGSILDGSRTTKDEVIKYVMEENALTELDDIVMIGDKSFDSIGAHANNIECVGILYGYGTIEEHKENNADYIVESITDLIKLF